MAPEYRVYVPPESVDKFEQAFSQIEGGEIKSKKKLRRDLPPITREENLPLPPIIRDDLTLDELALRVRSYLEELPENTNLHDLMFWNSSKEEKRRKGIQSPSEWIKLMEGLKASEKQRVSRAFNALGRTRPILSDLRDQNFNWDRIPQVRNLGEQGSNLLQIVFRT